MIQLTFKQNSTTRMATTVTTEATPYKGLPGSGFLGIKAGPDLSVEPDPQ